MKSLETVADPHRDEPVHHAGAALAGAAGAVLMLHGRGGSTEDILGLAEAMYHPRVAYLAPSAEGHRWYPQSFLAPREKNEPWLSSALKKVDALVKLAEDNGIPSDRIVICGFSQGACLATEYVASHPAKYGGLIAFTGGLIGPIGGLPVYSGDLQQTPAFLGSALHDPHIPWHRAEESAAILTRLNAQVTLRNYPGSSHTVREDEIRFANQMLVELFGPSQPTM